MLSPIRAASKSVTRRPSRKLKITPHMQPSDSPLKNNAKTLNGRGRQPNNTNDNSAAATERTMNRNRLSLRISETTLMPISLDKK